MYGLKAYAGGKGATHGHVALYSTTDNSLKALIECDLFGQTRTGAASGIATRLLANPDARTLGVIGSGKQSRAQVLAVCAVRPIKRINVFSRTRGAARGVSRVRWKRSSASRPAAPRTAQACVADADVVITITKSAEPVCRADWLSRARTSTRPAPMRATAARSTPTRCCAPP